MSPAIHRLPHPLIPLPLTYTARNRDVVAKCGHRYQGEFITEVTVSTQIKKKGPRTSGGLSQDVSSGVGDRGLEPLTFCIWFRMCRRAILGFSGNPLSAIRVKGGTAFVFGIPTPDGDSLTSPTHLQRTRLGPESRREPSPAPGMSRCKSPKAPGRFLAATQATPFSYDVTPRRIALLFQDYTQICCTFVLDGNAHLVAVSRSRILTCLSS